MSGTAGDRDDLLEEELRALLRRTDPVPAHVTEAAKASLGWRRLDADLAELLADSATEVGAALVRSAPGVRAVTFRTEGFELEAELHTEGDVVRLLGQLEPPGPARVVVQTDAGEIVTVAEADSLGRFRLTLLRGSRLRLLVHRQGRRTVETSWLTP